MVLALVPGLLAVTIVVLAPFALRNERWAVRRPDRAISCWNGLIATGTTLFATSALCALLVTVRDGTRPPDPAAWLEQTALALAAWIGLAAIGGVLALVWERSEPLADADRTARRRLNAVARTATYDREFVGGVEVLYVDSPAPLALAEQFGGRRILVTRGLRDALAPVELRAVLQHERCHLVRRHHLVLRIAAVNVACFPSLRGARAFEKSVHLLIEMSADDHAARMCGVDATAAALDTLAELHGAPTAALRAERLRRGFSAAAGSYQARSSRVGTNGSQSSVIPASSGVRSALR
ncbi:MAG TPA: M56 family metallopeptidase [Flexivirga sp.]|uniref:M56 family metallopeptidase n=1 Tax=Flexivirga sp. TaxID=1962927 RepID=UPI002CFDCFDB|nr:M56 family metallopeptidase [Flexivirga sp.]HWC22555.1 M56 family metallopeptidase [Flexivirga sp.]